MLNYGCNRGDLSAVGATTVQTMPKIFEVLGSSYGIVYSTDVDDEIDF